MPAEEVGRCSCWSHEVWVKICQNMSKYSIVCSTVMPVLYLDFFACMTSQIPVVHNI